MIGRYGRTVRASFIRRTFRGKISRNGGRTRRASVPAGLEYPIKNAEARPKDLGRASAYLFTCCAYAQSLLKLFFSIPV